VLPIIKHIPGHGRAMVDSHEHLPVVSTSLAELEKTDFIPFKELGDIPFAMTAHIIFEALDAKDPVTLSKAGIEYIRNNIGYKNLIMTDDLSMKALSGTFAERVQKAQDAGCDIMLHCNGNMSEMKEIASVTNASSASTIEYLANQQCPAIENDFKEMLVANESNLSQMLIA